MRGILTTTKTYTPFLHLCFQNQEIQLKIESKFKFEYAKSKISGMVSIYISK